MLIFACGHCGGISGSIGVTCELRPEKYPFLQSLQGRNIAAIQWPDQCKAPMQEIPVRLLKRSRPAALQLLRYLPGRRHIGPQPLSFCLSPPTLSAVFLQPFVKVLRMWSKSHVVWKHLHLFPLPDPSQITCICFTDHRHLILRLPRCRSMLCRVKIHHLQQFFFL